jgi:LCP family protein required for cell wall assembly
LTLFKKVVRMSSNKKVFFVFCCCLVLGLATAAYLGAVSFFRPLNASLKLNIPNLPASENTAQFQPKHPPAQAGRAVQQPAAQNTDQSQRDNRIVQLMPASHDDSVDPAEHEAVKNTPIVQSGEQPSLQQMPNRRTTTKADSGDQPSANEEGNCGASGSITILFLGTDEREEIPYGADVIRFIKADFSRLSITCVALSRDLLVKTPALADKHIKEYRLGEVFDIVQTDTKGDLKAQYMAATTALAQTLYDNFGVAPDHYLTVPQSSFGTLVDGLGGIDVDVPQDQDAYKYFIKAGKQNLNGQQALAYIRLFEGYSLGDFGRNSRQLPFIKAVIARIIKPANMVKIPGLLGRLQNSIVTDLSPALIASLTCLLGKVPRDRITFHTLQPEMTNPGRDDTLLPDTSKIQAWLQSLL